MTRESRPRPRLRGSLASSRSRIKRGGGGGGAPQTLGSQVQLLPLGLPAPRRRVPGTRNSGVNTQAEKSRKGRILREPPHHHHSGATSRHQSRPPSNKTPIIGGGAIWPLIRLMVYFKASVAFHHLNVNGCQIGCCCNVLRISW